jgi:hypothetical protein
MYKNCSGIYPLTRDIQIYHAMFYLEPYYNWENYYNVYEDELSPFYGYAQMEDEEHTNQVYNYLIHPEWNFFGSRTLYLKVLFVDYEKKCAIIQFIGEWNDAVENDIMQLKREVVDNMIAHGICKFILLCEHIMNFHADDYDYYQEWQEDIEDEAGYIALVNMPQHCLEEMQSANITKYFWTMEYNKWRTHQPKHFYHYINDYINKSLGI